jgi:hypothetical protein
MNAFGNALGNNIVSASSSGGSIASTAGRGARAADELSEVEITAQRIPTDADGYRLSNNPSNSMVGADQIVSPDEANAVSNGSAIPEVTVTSPHWKLGEELIYQQLMNSSLFGLNRYGEDRAAEQAHYAYEHDIRLADPLSRTRDVQLLLDGFSPYGHVKNAAVGVWNLGVKAAGGAASLPYLLDSGEAAQAVQDWFDAEQNLLGSW